MEQRQRRYPSDTSDAEWAILEPLVPPPKSGPARRGRPAWPRRSVVDAIFYVVRTGCSWRQLPADFPPWQTVYGHFSTWTADGTLEVIHRRLRDATRAAEGRDPIPSAGSIDAQSIRCGDTAGAATTGYDAGKRTKGRKRHAIVDTLGLLLALTITAANVQDRVAAVDVTRQALREHRGLRRIWADGGYTGRFVTWTQATYGVTVEIVNKLEGQTGFTVLPRRWVVERTFGWITRCRRLQVDYERRPEHAHAMIHWAMIGLMTRRLARTTPDHTVTPYNW
ncbi:IS5 family transposase [Iamia sp.]|uniref:IS5 family transposase n=1 Tax=Iamia sp. TaxID=2722710 RepID=UPI002C1DF4F4|nr:IS5 family transposase [Iamia sp.]HXH56771.1 IS5 family transposase [Iamia sp.]